MEPLLGFVLAGEKENGLVCYIYCVALLPANFSCDGQQTLKRLTTLLLLRIEILFLQPVSPHLPHFRSSTRDTTMLSFLVSSLLVAASVTGKYQTTLCQIER